MNLEKCKSILNHTLEQLNHLKNQDLTNNNTKIAIADVFWKASEQYTSEEFSRLKEWLEDRSSALDWHGEYDMTSNQGKYRRFLEKNIYVLKKILAKI